MCFDERNTERRGRLFAARRKLLRTRLRRRRKRAFDFSDITLLLFAFLPANSLGRVSDAFALVGFGWPIGANVGRDLTDALTVRSADGDSGRPLASDPDVTRDRERDIVTIAKLEIESVALNLRAITDARDLQVDRKPLRYPDNHVIDERPRGSPHRAGLLGVAIRQDRYRALGNRGTNFVADH